MSLLRSSLPLLATACLLLALGTGSATAEPGRSLSFAERVAAQEAIERVYYSHQTGANKPFHEAVPRSLLREKVRTYLKQSLALERFWNRPITAEMLSREMDRIAASTRMPERLEEIHDALDRDPFLIQECLVRQVLVDRLARGYFEADPETAGTASGVVRGSWDEWWPEVARDLNAGDARATADPDRGLPVTAAPSGWDPESARQALESGSGEASGLGLPAACLPDNVWESGTSLTSVWDPAPRLGHTAVWTGTHLLLWGGKGVHYLDTGEQYDPVTDTWTAISTDGAPASRQKHTAVWTGTEMIVWGGFWDYLWPETGNTGGRYDPATDTWLPTSTTGAPAARGRHTAVWTGSQMVIVFGLEFDTLDYVYNSFNDGGRYDPASDSWLPTAWLPYEGRHDHTAVWTGDRMIVWGGCRVWHGYSPCNGNIKDDGFLYDPIADTWSLLSTPGAPSPRRFHTAVWSGDRMIVWGGEDASGLVATGGIYDPNSDAWQPTSTAGAQLPRYEHTATWAGDRMVVWGGAGEDRILSQRARYDPVSDTWQTSAPGFHPLRRHGHTAIWTGNEMIVWGGQVPATTSTSSGDRYDPLTDTWAPTTQVGAAGPRRQHTAVWTGDRMIVWGGERGLTPTVGLDSGARYDPISDSWIGMQTAGVPTGRWNHTAVWTGDRMIVWGGSTRTPPPENAEVELNTGGLYDPVTNSWTPTAAPGGAERTGHASVWTGDRMFMWGGWTAGAPVGNGGLFDPNVNAWTSVSAVGAPSARRYHSLVWTGTEAILWGGTDDASWLDTGARYDPVADDWSTITLTGSPVGRVDHTAVWTGSRMVVWGGKNGTNRLGTGGVYDPVADEWSAVSMDGSPSARDGHTAVWTGETMLVWGGYAGGIAADGGRYGVNDSPDLDGDGHRVYCNGDCDDSIAEVYPGAPQACGDGLNNDCDHPSWPALAGTNEADDDGDTLSECAGDCNDGDGLAWSAPLAIAGMDVTEIPGGMRIAWDSQAAAAGPATVYDCFSGMTSTVAPTGDFSSGSCMTEDWATSWMDFMGPDPPVGEARYFLLRAQNSCPGGAGTYGDANRDATAGSSASPCN